MKENPILDMTFDFSISVFGLFELLQENKEYVISKQLLKIGMSIGANVEEVIGAISKREFISKMSIANKEARETKYWLRLLEKSKLVSINVNTESKTVN